MRLSHAHLADKQRKQMRVGGISTLDKGHLQNMENGTRNTTKNRFEIWPPEPPCTPPEVYFMGSTVFNEVKMTSLLQTAKTPTKRLQLGLPDIAGEAEGSICENLRSKKTPIWRKFKMAAKIDAFCWFSPPLIAHIGVWGVISYVIWGAEHDPGLKNQIRTSFG